MKLTALWIFHFCCFSSSLIVDYFVKALPAIKVCLSPMQSVKTEMSVIKTYWYVSITIAMCENFQEDGINALPMPMPE